VCTWFFFLVFSPLFLPLIFSFSLPSYSLLPTLFLFKKILINSSYHFCSFITCLLWIASFVISPIPSLLIYFKLDLLLCVLSIPTYFEHGPLLRFLFLHYLTISSLIFYCWSCWRLLEMMWCAHFVSSITSTSI
jgi:hypothetical protein